MILIRETDDGTEIHEPHIHNITGGPAMTITTYRNGRWCDTFDHPVPTWPELRRSYLDAGFVESEDKAELRAHIDLMYGTITVTVLFHAVLARPGTGDPDNPAGSYVDQANTALYRAGYLRLNNWWSSNDGLTTIVVKTPESLIPPTASAGIAPALQVAAGAIRGQLGIDSPDVSPTVAADHLRLCEDPAWKGFGAGLVEITQHDYPSQVTTAAESLLLALDYAARGGVSAVLSHTSRVLQLIHAISS